MNFNNILFVDIETVSQYGTYEELDLEWKELWDHKTRYLIKNPETETPDLIYPRAAIYAEFGKIVCISCGCIQGTGENRKLVIKSYSGDDEKKLLEEFCSVLHSWGKDNERLRSDDDPNKKFLCAHNGKEFDFPYLCRRLVINNIPLPNILKMQGKKPWQICHYDTMDLWKFGDYKSFTSIMDVQGFTPEKNSP